MSTPHPNVNQERQARVDFGTPAAACFTVDADRRRLDAAGLSQSVLDFTEPANTVFQTATPDAVPEQLCRQGEFS